MIYLLGGPPRVGKSFISSEIRQKHAVSVVSTDSLGAVLEHALSPETAPDLYVFSRFNEMPEADRVKVMVDNPAELVDYVHRESRVVWKAVETFIRREEDQGRDVVIEGVAVLPELVAQLEGMDHRAVFIGNQGREHQENIKRSAVEYEHDWMRHASDQYIEAFAGFVTQMSSTIEKEARRFGFEYIEMGKSPFHDAVDAVVDALFEHLS